MGAARGAAIGVMLAVAVSSTTVFGDNQRTIVMEEFNVPATDPGIALYQDAEKFRVCEAECRVVKSYSRLSCRRLSSSKSERRLAGFWVCGRIAGMTTPRPPPVCAAGRDCRQWPSA
jgi:hypothetical protein